MTWGLGRHRRTAAAAAIIAVVWLTWTSYMCTTWALLIYPHSLAFIRSKTGETISRL